MENTTIYIAKFKSTDSLQAILEATEDMAVEQVGHIWHVCKVNTRKTISDDNHTFIYELQFYHNPFCIEPTKPSLATEQDFHNSDKHVFAGLNEKLCKETHVCTLEITGREDITTTNKYRTIYIDIQLHAMTNQIMIFNDEGYKYDCLPEIKAGLNQLVVRFENYNFYYSLFIIPKIKNILYNYFNVEMPNKNAEPYTPCEIEEFIETHSHFIYEVVKNIIDDYGNADKLNVIMHITEDTIWKYMENLIDFL